MSEIIVGVEDSEEGREALRFARLFIGLEGASLHVVSVHSDTYFYEGVEAMEASRASYFDQMLEVAESELGGEFQFHRMMEISVPAGLTKVAERVEAEAMIIGSSHRGPIGRVLMGDQGSRLASGSPCAVIVIPRGWGRQDQSGISKVGIAYNGSGESEAALEFGHDLAGKLGASIELIGVVPAIINPGRIAHTDRGYQELLIDEMEKTVGAAVERFGKDEASTRVMTGNAADELAGASEDVDLLVVGSRSYGPLRRVLLGGTSFRVTRSAACPVVVVPRVRE